MWLAIDTALAACSVALIDDDGATIAALHEEIGRGHAERLVPMIAEVMAAAGASRADAIVVDVGPGSFTGLRVGIAAARALGLAWGVPVAGCTSTALVAALTFAEHPDLDRLLVANDAARGEVYVQAFARGLEPLDEVAALSPTDAASHARTGSVAVAGTGAALVAAADPTLVVASVCTPRAADAALLPPALRAALPRPLYVRAPDARLPGGLLPP